MSESIPNSLPAETIFVGKNETVSIYGNENKTETLVTFDLVECNALALLYTRQNGQSAAYMQRFSRDMKNLALETFISEIARTEMDKDQITKLAIAFNSDKGDRMSEYNFSINLGNTAINLIGSNIQVEVNEYFPPGSLIATLFPDGTNEVLFNTL